MELCSASSACSIAPLETISEEAAIWFETSDASLDADLTVLTSCFCP